MAKYTCIGCGFIFDEEAGVPAIKMAPNMNSMLVTGCGWHKNQKDTPPVGVEPGTKWEDVPAEFTCPSCGGGKDMFEN